MFWEVLGLGMGGFFLEREVFEREEEWVRVRGSRNDIFSENGTFISELSL